jgi:hypothetical protein
MGRFRAAGIVHIGLWVSDAESEVPPAEDYGNQPGEGSNPFTLRTAE